MPFPTLPRSVNFRSIRKFFGPPRFTTEGEAGKIGYAFGALQDAFIRRLELGLLARFPQHPNGKKTAPPDALAALGRDRRVVKGIFDTDDDYAARLITWLDERRTAGNPFTLLRQVAAYTGGCACRTVDVRGNWYSRDVNGVETAALKTGNWNWGGPERNAAGKLRWARFWLIVYPSARLCTTGPGAWGDAATAAWGAPDGICWGTDLPLEHSTTLRAIVADWMGPGKTCVNIILAFDPASFNPASPEPDGTWHHWSKVDGMGVRVPSRLGTARYLDGV